MTGLWYLDLLLVVLGAVGGYLAKRNVPAAPVEPKGEPADEQDDETLVDDPREV